MPTYKPRTHSGFSFILVLCLILGNALPALAASPAHVTLEGTVNSVMSLLKSSEFKNIATREQTIAAIEKEVEKTFDFNEFSARTIGPRWKTFTPEQQKNFIAAFSDLLRATYIDQLKDYNGTEVQFVGETSSSKGDKVEIKTMVLVNGNPTPVNYRLLEKNTAWFVYDVNIEGVSLVQNYRTQFQDILNKGDAENLIVQVLKKAEEIRKSMQSS